MSSITIVEGPGGSGKSTYITRILEKEGEKAQVIESLFTKFTGGDRFPSTEKAPLASLISDVAKALSTWPSQRAVLLDRFCLSQFVYQRIRENKDQEPFEVDAYRRELTSNLSLMMDILEHTYDWVYGRGMQMGRFKELNLLIVLPAPEVLIHRRNMSGRKFPYGLRDHQEYQRVADIITETGYAEQFGFNKVEVLKR